MANIDRYPLNLPLKFCETAEEFVEIYDGLLSLNSAKRGAILKQDGIEIREKNWKERWVCQAVEQPSSSELREKIATFLRLNELWYAHLDQGRHVERLRFLPVFREDSEGILLRFIGAFSWRKQEKKAVEEIEKEAPIPVKCTQVWGDKLKKGEISITAALPFIFKTPFQLFGEKEFSALCQQFKHSKEETLALFFHSLLKELGQNQKNPVLVFLVGYCYFRAIGTPGDERLAYHQFNQADQLGFPLGSLYLGRCYHSGIGVELSDGEAFRLVEKAARQNLPSAWELLGSFHEKGRAKNEEELKRNYREAIQCYEQAITCGSKTVLPDIQRCRKRLGLKAPSLNQELV